MPHERLGYSPDVIEAQLAHTARDSLGRAYNRTGFVAQRREMLQTRADYLDLLRSGKDAVPARRRRPAARHSRVCDWLVSVSQLLAINLIYR